jgi:hypothetical protein
MSMNDSSDVKCPSCGRSDTVTFEWLDEQFGYGAAPDTVTLVAHVPVGSCSECDLSWTDHRGEEIRSKVVADYLASRRLS